MKNISEAELKEILKEYIEKEVVIEINGIINAGVVINKLAYIISPNKMIFADEMGNIQEVAIETELIYQMKYDERRKYIEIKIDNEQKVSIEL